ncbi:MAG: radical SAM protein [Pseudomonadota bacterium]
MSELLEVVGSHGMPEVAVVHVARLRQDPRLLVEMVDGLDPPRPRLDKWIVNISTQIGCPVGCPYCDAGGDFQGHLSAAELLAQVRWVLSQHPDQAASCRKLKIHFARMGEPAYNDAVIEALWQLPQVVQSPGLWACLATVAPRGQERFFDALLDVKRALYRGRFQLQFSLNTTDDALRRQLIPVPHWGPDAIADYGERFVVAGDRRVVLNFALAEGVPFDPAVLLCRFDPLLFTIKLTPLNPTARGDAHALHTVLRAGARDQVDVAVQRLRAGGFDVILSVGDPREDQIGSNCGQAVRVLRSQQVLCVPDSFRRGTDAATTS